jgi:hypothetical protein
MMASSGVKGCTIKRLRRVPSAGFAGNGNFTAKLPDEFYPRLENSFGGFMDGRRCLLFNHLKKSPFRARIAPRELFQFGQRYRIITDA